MKSKCMICYLDQVIRSSSSSSSSSSYHLDQVTISFDIG